MILSSMLINLHIRDYALQPDTELLTLMALHMVCHPVVDSPYCTVIQTTFQWLVNDIVTGSLIKRFTEIEVHSKSFLYQSGYLVKEGAKICFTQLFWAVFYEIGQKRVYRV